MSVIGAERYLFTIEEFDRLYEVGLFTEDDRIEFLDGEIIAMSATGGRHVRTLSRFIDSFFVARDSTIQLSVQSPVRIGGRASFLPDAVIVRAAPEATTVPTADEILIVLEVSDSSRIYDRDTKLPAYASANIPEAWIFDLASDRIERHTDPQDGIYKQVATAERGEQIASTILPKLIFDVAATLGPRETDDQ
jgi:Uma2 family endonuclease